MEIATKTMKRFQYFTPLALLIATIFLQGCQTSASNSRPWEYKSQPRVAEATPNDLSDAATQEAPVEAQPMTMQQRVNLPPVKVGILLPLSGKNANLGEAMLNAAQMAMFEIGHQSFQLIPRDTQGTSAGGRSAAKDAIDNGAQLILGPVFADAVRGAKSVARSRNVNMIAYSTDWTLADNSTFIMGILPFDQVERVIRYAAAQGLTNVGVLSPANKYGDAVLNAYNRLSFNAGINTVDTKRFSPNTSSLNTTMRQFAKYDQRQARDENGAEAPPPFDAIFMPVGGNLARTVGSFASQYSMRPDQVRRLGTGLLDDEALASNPDLAGALFAAPSPVLRREFERKYFSTYGVSPPRIATLAYDSTALAAVLARSGLQQSGRPFFDSVSIQNPNGFAGVDGIFRFREGGLVDRGLAVLEYRRGQISIADPAPKTFQQRGF